MKTLFIPSVLVVVLCSTAYSQDNYEIQVYGSETVAEGVTMVEHHSNYSPDREFNFGTGWGLTQSTDGLVVKMILGRRFGG